MAKKVLRDVEIWFAKLVRPDTFRGGDPKWTLQMRTQNEEQSEEWEELGFTVKHMKPKKSKGEDFEPYWRANINRKVQKADGTEREPVVVVDASLSPVDAKTIGNGSIGNIQFTAWEMEIDGEQVDGRLLEKVQLTKHIIYTPRDFEEGEELELLDSETEVVTPTKEEDDEVY